MAAAAPGRRPAGAVNAPLDGILVADFTRVLAGPLATMTLADLGAEVVKVERPGAGDDTRQWGPPWTGQGSSYFECVNRSKQSITLDLRLRDRPRRREGPGRPGRRAGGELPDRHHGPARPRVRRGGRAEPAARLLLDHRVRQRGGCLAPRLRLRRPGPGRPDEHHRRPGRGAHQGQASRWWTCSPARTPRSASWPRCRSGSAPAAASGSRSTCSRACSGHWPTRPRPTSRPAPPRRGWATGIRP